MGSSHPFILHLAPATSHLVLEDGVSVVFHYPTGHNSEWAV